MKKLFKLIIVLLILCSLVVCFTARLFPLNYKEEISAASEEYGVSPSLIAAIIKTESNWNENAVSSAGAKGLMQISDKTFEWIASKDDDVFDPATNIKYGCMYLSRLLNIYGDLDTALAAYNAGSGNVDKWLLDSRYSDDGKTLKTTPYGETNKYSKRIALYKRIYDLIYDI